MTSVTVSLAVAELILQLPYQPASGKRVVSVRVLKVYAPLLAIAVWLCSVIVAAPGAAGFLVQARVRSFTGMVAPLRF